MNVLHLEASTGWGGQEIRILKESIEMRKRGHNVILCVMTQGKLIEKAKEQNFIVYELNFKKSHWISCFYFLLKIIKEHKIDVINTHSSLDSWIGGLVGRIYGCKVIRTRHLSTDIRPGINSKILYGYLADFVVTTCQEVVSKIIRQSGKSSLLVRSIATGVDPKAIQIEESDVTNFRQKYKIQESTFLVGTACVMRSWKGIDVLLQAALKLKNHPHIRFCIIGGGHEKTYHDRAKELGIFDEIIFTGHLDNPFPAIKALDCFALLSTANEGVSQAILQASYLCKPLIATKTGGLAEVCIEGETGFSVPCFDVDSVVDAILKLENDRTLCAALGRNAHDKVVKEFTIKKTIDLMEQTYEKILNV